MRPDKINVLYVDDEAPNLKSFKANFRRDFQIFIAESAAEGKEILKDQDIHVVITDQRMPKETGVEFLSSILHDYPEPVRIMVTGYSDLNAVIDAINKGQVFRFIKKPWDSEEMKAIINEAYEEFARAKEREELNLKLLKSNEQLEFMLRQRLLD